MRLLKKSTLKEQAYDYLKYKIKNCLYIPGEAINEMKIAEETGMGRTPIREALLALKEENLIEVKPRKGTFVADITETQVNESYQIRRILEPVIAVKYKLSFDKGRLLAFDEMFSRLDVTDDEAYFNLDVRFHEHIVEAAGNPAINGFFQKTMFGQYRIGIYNSIHGLARKENYYQEHHDIIMALLEEDDKKIEEANVRHISNSHIISLQAVKEIKRGQN